MEIVLQILDRMERSQSWLARKINVSPTLITLWKQGLRPISDEHKESMAGVLDVKKEILF